MTGEVATKSFPHPGENHAAMLIETSSKTNRRSRFRSRQIDDLIVPVDDLLSAESC